MTTGIRRALLVAGPLVLAVVLWCDAIQDYNRNAIITDPSLSLILGTLGWMTAMIAAAVAFRRDKHGVLRSIPPGPAAKDHPRG